MRTNSILYSGCFAATIQLRRVEALQYCLRFAQEEDNRNLEAGFLATIGSLHTGFLHQPLVYQLICVSGCVSFAYQSTDMCVYTCIRAYTCIYVYIHTHMLIILVYACIYSRIHVYSCPYACICMYIVHSHSFTHMINFF